MMGAETIRDMQSAAASMAARDHKRPLICWENSIPADLKRMPNLGDYIPDGWRSVEPDEFSVLDGCDSFFCDSSGFGSPGEPAMGFDRLCGSVETLMREAAEMSRTVGFGIIEEGQFQVYIGCFVRE